MWFVTAPATEQTAVEGLAFIGLQKQAILLFHVNFSNQTREDQKPRCYRLRKESSSHCPSPQTTKLNYFTKKIYQYQIKRWAKLMEKLEVAFELWAVNADILPIYFASQVLRLSHWRSCLVASWICQFMHKVNFTLNVGTQAYSWCHVICYIHSQCH